MAIISDYQEENQEQTMKPMDKEEENSSSMSSSAPKEEGNSSLAPEEEEENKKLKPNKSNGLDMDNYSWGQSLQEVTINVPVPPGTKSRFLVVEIKKSSLKVGLKNQEPILEGEYLKAVKVDECYWSLEDQKEISILLTKQDKCDWWNSLLKGGPEIDTHKVEPEPSRLSELDTGTRAAVEKMMFDTRQKRMGLPSSEEIKNQQILKQFLEQNPRMVNKFGHAKMMPNKNMIG